MTLNSEQLAGLRNLVESRCRALAEELHGDAARSREETFGSLAGPVTDSAEEAVADVIADVGNAALSRDLAELRAMEAARLRLDKGGYGRCADCDAGIPYGRLAAQPAALRCIDCQRLRDRRFAHPGGPKL